MAKWSMAAGIVAVAGAVLVAGPQLKTSWRNPDPAAAPVSKVVVVGFTSEQATRRSLEDALTAEIRKNGSSAEPSYSVVPGDLSKDPSAAKAKLIAAGFDGLVLVRVAGVSTEQSWDPGYMTVVPSYYASPWSYWGHYYSYAWDPYYFRTYTTVRIETVAYAVNGEVLIWTGLSQSTNPSSVSKLVKQVATAVGTDLKKRNVVR